MKKAAVIGWPIKHSMSPVLHNYWLKHYNIQGSYEKIAVEPIDFGHFIGSLQSGEYQGINITVPYKELVVSLLNNKDASVIATGAANVVTVSNGRLFGTNTDMYGFTKNLEESGMFPRKKRAVILGSGGAARSVIKALENMGFEEVHICARNQKKARDIKSKASLCTEVYSWINRDKILSGCDLLVNTTTLGMQGKESLDIDLSHLPRHAVVYDIVYNPLLTDLLLQAQERGLMIVDGLGMLMHQAVPCFEAWFGVRPEVTVELKKHILEYMP
ncbi:MAG: shikimate dehydrogenase [Alphaproteobacteria bacterium]